MQQEEDPGSYPQDGRAANRRDLPKDVTNKYPPMQEQYGGSSAHPDTYTPTVQIQENPVKEEPASCDGRNMTDPSQQDPFPYIKEEPGSCDGGVLVDPDIYTPDIRTQHPFPYIKKEPGSRHGENLEEPEYATLYPTQQYPECEPVLEDAETLEIPNVYVTKDHAQQCPPPLVPCGGGRLICNAQHGPTSHGEEATNCPNLNHPESQRQPGDLLHVQFSCSECKKCFLSMAELVSHQGVHIAEKLLQTQIFTTTIVHAAQVEPVKHKLLTCSTCGRTFYTKSSLVGHMKTHWGKVSKTFKSNQCGKSFELKSQLSVHSRLHVGYRPYVCSTCGERFMRTGDLKKHQKKHRSGV